MLLVLFSVHFFSYVSSVFFSICSYLYIDLYPPTCGNKKANYIHTYVNIVKYNEQQKAKN